MTCLAALCLIGAIAIDGDTLRVPRPGDDLRVRLHGIDAPELRERGGPAARAALAALIEGRTLACNDHGPDRYGRTVGRCDLPDGRNVACVMVATGHARDWLRYSKGRYAGCAGARPRRRPQ